LLILDFLKPCDAKERREKSKSENRQSSVRSGDGIRMQGAPDRVGR
jgi:hypothetical protein